MTKVRSSRSTAEWSKTREGHYEQFCDEILYRRGFKLDIDNDQVYLISTEMRTLLLKINKRKTQWYEIWLKLKEI
ncbi:hypothetical protein HQ865_13080 [Mucilaginibacter mali]|uniref:Uncharacterized protein n=1 Tax=Mucilaginibacter mali TaxID=2740462 RepID=A0A7D4Q427_9SPHI|nr:hypothetical protein [Mucilaginibacter mali]QKJ30647.1 hypothetical protein HQ865_13080 [Mucilaginibacter mali]